MKLKTICAGLASLALSAIAVGTAPSHAEDKKPYTIYLSNNFVGNDWRQQMERVATVSVEQGAAEGPRRSQDRERREHRSGADQLAQQHHPPEAGRHPGRRRFGFGAQPDHQEGLRRRHRRHQLRPGGDRALRLRRCFRLGPHSRRAWPSGWPRSLAARATCIRRPRPCRRADLGTAAGRLREGAGKNIPTSRSSATTTATTRSDRSSRASRHCSPPTRRSTAS